ncbi:MAG: hypothetical protein WCH34_02675 [Bacteroidota bacterium]
MSTLELKKSLIHRIVEINDINFLKAIKTILDAKAHDHLISLTSEQKLEILESKKEIEKGLYIEQSELEKEVNSWLSSK